MWFQFKGSLRAREAHCKHQISMWYKDRQFLLRKLNKEEEEMYGLMMQVHQEKKRLEKEGSIRRDSWMIDSSLKADALDLNLPSRQSVTIDDAAKTEAQSPVREVKQLPVESGISSNEESESKESNKQKRNAKTAAMTAMKDNNEGGYYVPQTTAHDKTTPTTLQQSDAILKTRKPLASKPQSQSQQYVTTEIMPLSSLPECKQGKTRLVRPMPRISESGPLTSSPTSKENTFASQPLSKEDTFIYDSAPVGGTTRERVILQTPSPKPHSQSATVYHSGTDVHDNAMRNSVDMYELERSRDSHDIPTRSQSADFDAATRQQRRKRQSVGLILINRNMNQKQSLQRKRILDNEPPQIYDRNDKGELVATHRTFKRKSFAVPTLKEVRQRQKLLGVLRQKQEAELDLMHSFLRKVDEEKGTCSAWWCYCDVIIMLCLRWRFDVIFY